MDKIEICNLALTRIGVDTINSLDESSQPARVCRQCYDFVRQNVLRRYPWAFATRRITLALLETEPVDYKYAYRYPSDAIGIRGIYNEYMLGLPRDNHFKILSDKQGKVLYTNIENALVEYTADIKDASLFDAMFIDAFAWRLAAEMAMALTNNMNIMQNAVQAYNAYFVDAVGEDAAEDNVDEAKLDRLALARFAVDMVGPWEHN